MIGRSQKEGRHLRDLLTYLIIKAMIIKGNMDLNRLWRNTRDARKKNEKLLFEILRKNRDCAFGKAHHFDEIKSLEDYRRNVPLSVFSDYEEDIDRMINSNEEDRLFSAPLVGYARTSGSTGAVKYIPLTQSEVDTYTSNTLTIMMALADRYQREKYGHGLRPGRGMYGANSMEQFLPNGRLCSNIADVAALQLGFIYPYIINIPFKKLFKINEALPNYVNLRFALEDPNTSYIFAIFSSNLSEALNYLKQNWPILVEDIEKGTISEISLTDEATRAKLLKVIRPNPKRASELRKEFEKGFDDTIIRRIWPNMAVIASIGNGIFAPFTKDIKTYAGDVPIDYLIYGASEGLFATVDALESEKRLLIVNSCFYEFIPQDDETKICTIDELEPGKEYEIIITNQAGLYRYHCGDVIKVDSYMNECPYILFSHRKGHLLSVTGEKTTEDHMTAVVERVREKAGCGNLNWSVCINTNEFPTRYILLLENDQGLDLRKYSQFATEELKKENPRYADMFAFKLLGDMEIRNLKKGTNEEWKQLIIGKGASLSQVKPVTVLDTEEKEQFFLSRVVSE